MEKLDATSFDEMLGNDLFTHQNGSPVVFDLTGVKFVAPSALVQLAAACHALARNGRKPKIAIDVDAVRSYVARAGFVSVIEDVAEMEPFMSPFLYGSRRGANPLLIEVTRVKSGNELPDLLDQIVWVLRNRLKYKKFDAFDVATAISEICQNTFDHNQYTCGFLAMQVYGKGSRLHHLLELTYKHEGSVQIRSGAAKVRYRMDKRKGWFFSVPLMPGVQVALQLRSKAA
jgi:hypothetical protein